MDGTVEGLSLIQSYQDNNGIVKALGMQLRILDAGYVTYTLNVQNKHLATPGFVHGGVLTTMLDATMGAGALTLVAEQEQVVSTIEMQVNFLMSAKINETLVCTSTLIRKGRKVIFMKAEIRNEQNQLVAVSNGSFYPFSAAKAGYKLN